MPFYTFKCGKCSHSVEIITKSDDREDRMCSECGCAMKRQFPLTARPCGFGGGGSKDGGWTFGKQTSTPKIDGVPAEEAAYNDMVEADKSTKEFVKEGGIVANPGAMGKSTKNSKKAKK